MFRLRLGIVLIILSWLPFAQVFLMIAHDHGRFVGEESSTKVRLVIWGIQLVIGLIGLWLAGKVAIGTVKKNGRRQAPARLWHMFWHGPNN